MSTDGKAARASVGRLAGEPHRRYNPLMDEWVLVSAGRTRRPWLGAEEPTQGAAGLAYDPDCYLCPGNTRANGNANPAYTDAAKHATVLVSASVVVTAVVVPFLTAWWSARHPARPDS